MLYRTFCALTMSTDVVNSASGELHANPAHTAFPARQTIAPRPQSCRLWPEGRADQPHPYPRLHKGAVSVLTNHFLAQDRRPDQTVPGAAVACAATGRR